MSILSHRELEEFDRDAQKYISYFELPGMQLKIKGSSVYKNLLYRSDYDILISVKIGRPAAEVFNHLRSSLEKIEKDTNTFFIELKLQTKDDQKIRFYHKDVFSFSDFEKYYAQLKFFKVDIVICVKDMLWEASAVYSMMPESEIKFDDLVKDIKKDMEEYRAEGQYYKVLKRVFSLNVLYQNIADAEFLIRIFNSKLGKLYERICNMKAIELLYTYYSTDSKALEKIDKNLKLIHEPDDIKTLHKNIDKYYRSLNRDAKKIYDKMKDDFRFA